LPLILGTIILGIFPNIIMDILHASVINLTTYI
jgi:NADH:ubiquinone oxidoreductase subunit 4 (subunit M)